MTVSGLTMQSAERQPTHTSERPTQKSLSCVAHSDFVAMVLRKMEIVTDGAMACQGLFAMILQFRASGDKQFVRGQPEHAGGRGAGRQERLQALVLKVTGAGPGEKLLPAH